MSPIISRVSSGEHIQRAREVRTVWWSDALRARGWGEAARRRERGPSPNGDDVGKQGIEGGRGKEEGAGRLDDRNVSMEGQEEA